MTNFTSEADLVAKIGSTHFGVTVMEAFRRHVAFDHAALSVFDNGVKRPCCLMNIWSGEKPQENVDHLATEGDVQVEVLERHRSRRPRGGGVRIVDYSKPVFLNNSNNKRRSDEISLDNEVAVFEDVDNVSFCLELFRSGRSRRFSPDDTSRIRSFWPFARTCINKHIRLSRVLPAEASEVNDHVELLSKTFRQYGLSPREAEICAYIVSGHSTTAISLILSISNHTVSTLRRRAYRRLNISSQNELFYLYLQYISGFVYDGAVDAKALNHAHL